MFIQLSLKIQHTNFILLLIRLKAFDLTKDYIPRNVSVRPHQVNHHARLLMSYWEIICITFCNGVYLHLTFLSDLFKCLMLFTNLLQFSSII